MMKRAQLASEALAAWTLQALRDGERSVSQQQLPAMDVATFFKAFAQAPDLPPKISLALVGFGSDTAALKAMARKAGVSCFSEFATDLHVAAAWRNARHQHPVIMAYARGMVSGVNTLGHFALATSRELTEALLRWAVKCREFTATPAHARLLGELQALAQERDVFSFEQIRAFLEAWSAGSGPSAPRNALPALGLLPDPNLFADATLIRKRLEQNIDFMDALRDRSTGQMEAVRKRLSKADGRSTAKTDIRARLKAFQKLQTIRHTPTSKSLGALALDEGLKVFAPPPKADAPIDPTEVTDASETHTLNDRKLQKASAESLLDNREQELVKNAEALSKGLREALDRGEESGDEDHWHSDVEIDGETRSFQAELDRPFVGWIRHFCKADVWGGLVQTTTPDLRRALEDFDRPDTLLLNPENLLRVRGDDLGLTKLLKAWDDDIHGSAQGPLGFVANWNRLKELRTELLGSLEELTHFPLEWFAGKTSVRGVAEEYLRVTGQLFGLVARHYGAMAQTEPRWAKTTLEGLLALDVVQARVRRDDGKIASKAVLLPTHPLHLWRYWRLRICQEITE